VVDENIQLVEGPSGQYGDSWDIQKVGGTVLGGVEPVREVVELCREIADAGVVKDTMEAEDRHSGGDE
jgi:hypothetical protein